jgi:hypothetical protein
MSENNQYHIPDYSPSGETKFNDEDELRFRMSALESPTIVDATLAAYHAAAQANMESKVAPLSETERFSLMGRNLRAVRQEAAGMDLDEPDSVQFINDQHRELTQHDVDLTA